MKVKRKIISPKLRDYFRFDSRYQKLSTNVSFNFQIFNPFAFMTVLSFFCLVLGIFFPVMAATGGSGLIMLLALYFKTKFQCEGLTIRRSHPEIAREKGEITIMYAIANETAFPISSLTFKEEFDGVGAGVYTVSVDRVIPPHTQVRVETKLILDGGMGIKKWNPLKLHFRDELGFFDFKMSFEQDSSLEVHPFIEEIPPIRVAVSLDSIDFGLFELAKKGDSNLFIGTREYRHGDPVRHINWKLSQKGDKVIINEFEKNTNTYITFLVELDLKHQVGFAGVSTWEGTKDLVLSMCVNEGQRFNSYQVISHNFHLPFGQGKKHLELLEKYFTLHQLEKATDQNHLRRLYDLPSGGQVVYVCPRLLSPEVLATFEHLKILQSSGQKVFVVSIDPFFEVSKSVEGEAQKYFAEIHRHQNLQFLALESELKASGIRHVNLVVSSKPNFKKQIIEKVPDLLDVK